MKIISVSNPSYYGWAARINKQELMRRKKMYDLCFDCKDLNAQKANTGDLYVEANQITRSEVEDILKQIYRQSGNDEFKRLLGELIEE